MTNQFIQVKVVNNSKFKDPITLHKTNILGITKIENKTILHIVPFDNENQVMIDETYSDFIKRAGTDILP
jgi:hypothetical protein